MMYVSTGEPCGTTSSEDGEQEPCEPLAWWILFLIIYPVVGVVIATLMVGVWPCKVSDYLAYVQRRRQRRRLRTSMILFFWWVACCALWPIWLVAYLCLSLWRITTARIDGIPTRRQDNEATDTSRAANSHWHRRGWLVLLRARHQRIAAASVSSRGGWTGCCRRQNGLSMRVVPPPREKDALESGQGSVAKDITALRFRTLLMRVVEHEEEGVFRSIVGYL